MSEHVLEPADSARAKLCIGWEDLEFLEECKVSHRYRVVVSAVVVVVLVIVELLACFALLEDSEIFAELLVKFECLGGGNRESSEARKACFNYQ
jgi:hypothetical protein